jgi:hypothetical protein
MPGSCDSAVDPAAALHRAAQGYERHEEVIGRPGPAWPVWYAHGPALNRRPTSRRRGMAQTSFTKWLSGQLLPLRPA